MIRTWQDATVVVEMDDAWPEVISVRSGGDSVCLSANDLRALRDILIEVLPLLSEGES